ncbi:unnamed protein product [Mytilus edulis]|uniref:Uncharacterized protein n=1 Tax=Mytilus edulis TaxID=6550 RepID=A0A8S3UTT6_MYTED|nr:unnamed protein product [Mytilus edulis]
MSLQASVANDSEGSNVLNHLCTNLGNPRLNNSGKLNAFENLESSKLNVMEQTLPKMLIPNTGDAKQTLVYVVKQRPGTPSQIPNVYEQKPIASTELKRKLIRAEDSYKLQTDISSLQKELTICRLYIITLESDKLDLEHSLRIHKQKLANEFSQHDNYISFKNTHNHNAASHCHQGAEQDSIKVWVLEQRIKTLEFDIIKQDNKMSNLQDKVSDMHIHHMYNKHNHERQRGRRKRNGNNNTNNNGYRTHTQSCSTLSDISENVKKQLSTQFLQ